MIAESRTTRLRGRPRASDSADTRERILRSARDVFRELGYEGTTNMKIATHADLTRPAINYHFTCKRDLFRTVVEANLAILDEALNVAGAREATLRGRLHALITAADTDAELRAAAGLLTVADVEYQRHPELRSDGWDIASGLRSFLTTSAAGALENGELRADTDICSLVDALHAMLTGIAFRSCAVRDRGRHRAQADALMQLITGDLFATTSGDRSDEPARLG